MKSTDFNLLLYVTNPKDWEDINFAYRFYHTKSNYESIIPTNTGCIHYLWRGGLGEEGIEIDS